MTDDPWNIWNNPHQWSALMRELLPWWLPGRAKIISRIRERELETELAYHVEMTIDVPADMAPKPARRSRDSATDVLRQRRERDRLRQQKARAKKRGFKVYSNTSRDAS